jgi:hypothetical protein
MADPTYGTPPTGYGGYGGSGGMDPALMAALMAGSSGQEDQANLQAQMKMAEALRTSGINPLETTGGRSGLAVTPRTPIASALTGITGAISMNQQMKALKAMKANAAQLRAMRGMYQDALAKSAGLPGMSSGMDPGQFGAVQPVPMAPGVPISAGESL